jgi:uncharacterized protein YbbC (DUF1343 family)
MMVSISIYGQVKHRFLTPHDLKTGAQRTELYMGLIREKNIGILANHTSMIGNSHLVDSLHRAGIRIKKIFSPEHGFRGKLEAGEKYGDITDPGTGIAVVSMYGKKLKPSDQDLAGIQVMLIDLQDVGVRFYTYVSSMQNMMEACARTGIQVIVLDRPNPNGYFIDGPVLDAKEKSFVGMNPIPLVHGMTMGELAEMINGEGWLPKGLKCSLKVVPVFNYGHTDFYQLPNAPSPNLPNMASVYLYPSLGLFEGTIVSVGRGTGMPFQVIGYPGLKDAPDRFTPVAMEGFALNPPHKDKECKGYVLKEFGETFIRDGGKIYLFWLIELYRSYPDKKHFFNDYFDRLAGTSELRKMIIHDASEEEIRNTWKPGINAFKKLRKKYLLYPDFE